MEILTNNYKLPKIPIDDFNAIGNIINSVEFVQIYNFYIEQLNNTRLKDLPDYEKRLAFYLTYTGQDQYIQHMNNMLYQRHSPSINEFLQDPQYLGAYWSTTYPYWRKQLQYIFDDTNAINTAVFSGAIGTGKSTIARRGFLYALYRMCCLRYPHSVLNVTADTTLAAVIISVTLEQVNKTVMMPMTQMLEAAPCFQRVKKLSHFQSFKETDPVPYVIENGGIRFPNNIFMSAGSQVQHVIGASVFSSIFDEAEEKANLDQALELFTAIQERIRSRFLGSNLTYSALISSAKTKSGIVFEYTKNIPKDDPYVHIMNPPIWEVKQFDAYSKGYFYVLVGTQTNPSKILDIEREDIEAGRYEPPYLCSVIKVPLVYRRDFEGARIEAAIQNLAGMTTDTSDRPFTDVDKIEDPNLVPEFHMEAPLGSPIRLLQKLPKDLFVDTPYGPRLARYARAPRYIHLDLATSAEAGFTMVHKEFKVNEFGESETVYVADIVSWITSPNRIDLSAIEQLVIDLNMECGVIFGGISADQFQSSQTRQNFEKKNISKNVQLLSVDRTPNAYLALAALVATGNFKAGKCPYLKEQLLNLAVENNKVVRRQCRKDISDSIAGGVELARTNLRDVPVCEYRTEFVKPEFKDLAYEHLLSGSDELGEEYKPEDIKFTSFDSDNI